MALEVPPVWPPATIASLSLIRFVIDVSEPESTDVLVELFDKHIKVHSFPSLDEFGFVRVVEDAKNQATIVITDDSCRPTVAVAHASSRLQSFLPASIQQYSSMCAPHCQSKTVNFKLEKLIFQTRVNRVLASQKKFIAMNADRYMSKWANHCVTVISASAALNFLYRADVAAAASSLSSASFVSPAPVMSSLISSASRLVQSQQFRGLGRQAKAATALSMQSFVAATAAPTLTSSANNGSGGSGISGGGGFLSSFSGAHRGNSNLKFRATTALGARAGISHSATGSLLSSTASSVGSRANFNNPLIHHSAVAAGSIASASTSVVSAPRSVSYASVFLPLLPGLLPPPPGFKRFSLVDSHGKYLPLIKDYATDPKRGQLAPVLDLHAPPYCCPFNMYTKNDHERERQKETRRCEARKVAAAAEAADAAEAAEEARRAAKISQVVKDALNAELQSSSLSLSPSSLKSLMLSLSSSSLLSSSAAAAPNDLQPTTRERLAQEQSDLTAVYEREMAIKRAKMARPGYCELCDQKYSDLGNHLVSNVHLQLARDPSTFECIDAVAARHEKVLTERAVTDEVNHHVLKLLMLKHPDKFAELDWIFPKLARWVALRRQAEKNVAERHRLAAEATKETAASSSNNVPNQHSTTHAQCAADSAASPLPTLSSPLLLDTIVITRGDEHDSCSSLNPNAAVHSNVRKRSFDQTIPSLDTLSCDASQSHDAPFFDRPSHNSESSAPECIRSADSKDPFGNPFAASLEPDSRALSISVLPRGFSSGEDEPTASAAGTLTKNPSFTTRSAFNSFVRIQEVEISNPAARLNRTARSPFQVGDTTSSSLPVMLSTNHCSAPSLRTVWLVNSSFDATPGPASKHLAASSAISEAAADAIIRRGTEPATITPLPLPSSGTISHQVSAIGTNIRIPMFLFSESIV